MKLALLVVVCLLVCAAQAACPYNGCSCGGNKISCNHNGLTSMPSLNSGSWPHTVMDLSRNLFTDIPDGSVKGGLETFETWFTPLQTMGDHVLDGSHGTLKRAIIERHNLTAVPKTFASMGSQFIYMHLPWGQISDISVLSQMRGSLTHMEMRGNRISDQAALQAAFNTHRNTLMRAWFMHNQINEMPNTFSGFPKFLEIGLDSNNISDVPDNTMSRGITVIQMRDNKLTKIPKDFEALTGLWDLLLDGNEITTFDQYNFNPKLTNLHLRRNKIDAIHHMRFPHGTRLRWLQLGDNPLWYIEKDVFAQATELRQIGLSNTKLTRLPAVPMQYLPKMIMLYLNHIPMLECTCQEAGMPVIPIIGGYCSNNNNQSITEWLHTKSC